MMQNHNQQKKIALINDFTGFGRCSIAVQMPRSEERRGG